MSPDAASPGTGEVDLDLNIQLACTHPDVPSAVILRRAVLAALHGRRHRAALTVRVIDAGESQTLNRQFRGPDKPTNVLSFPASGLEAVWPEYLGDIAICAPLVAEEADQQGKNTAAHWQHLCVHGVLHLLGFDHQSPADAAWMEGLERAILAGLGLADPYQTDPPHAQ